MEIDQTIVVVAAIGLIPAMIASIGVPLIQAKIKSKEKQEDNERTDQLEKAKADKAEETSRKLLERQDTLAAQQRDAAALLLAANERVAQSTEIVAAKVDGVHTLVNSQMTVQKQINLDTMKRQLVLLLSVVDLKKTAGLDSNGDAQTELDTIRIKIGELEIEVAERIKKQAEIDRAQGVIASQLLPKLNKEE